MSDLCFSKVDTKIDGERLVVFERGRFSTPILFLEKREVEELIEEWKRDN